jgi:DNA (cytosine-5)-methyltransferase 1
LNEKIICEERTDEGIRFFKDGCCGTIRTIEAGGDKRVIEINRLGNIYGEDKGTGYAGNVWDDKGLCPTITTMQGGNREPMIVASRGRNKGNPSDRKQGIELEQRLEPNSEGICNTLTSVQKDNLLLTPNNWKHKAGDGTKTRSRRISEIHPALQANTGASQQTYLAETPYRIRKLTPKECAKLMKFSDEDANKMLEVNSNTQVYKQCGNSIVVSVLEAIFCQMNIKGCPTWEERAKEEYL